MAQPPQVSPLRSRPVENLLWDASRAVEEAQGKVKEALSYELKDRLHFSKKQHKLRTELDQKLQDLRGEMNKNNQLLVQEAGELRQQNQILHQQNAEQAKHLHRLQSETEAIVQELEKAKSTNCLITQDMVKLCEENSRITQELDQTKEQIDIVVLERQITELALDQYKDEVSQRTCELDQYRMRLMEKNDELRDIKEQLHLYEGMLTSNESTIGELQRQLDLQSLINAESTGGLGQAQESEEGCQEVMSQSEELQLNNLKRSRSSTPRSCGRGEKRQKTGL